MGYLTAKLLESYILYPSWLGLSFNNSITLIQKWAKVY